MSILSLVELHDLSEVSAHVFRRGIDLGVVLPAGTAVGYPAPAARRRKTPRPSGNREEATGAAAGRGAAGSPPLGGTVGWGGCRIRPSRECRAASGGLLLLFSQVSSGWNSTLHPPANSLSFILQRFFRQEFVFVFLLVLDVKETLVFEASSWVSSTFRIFIRAVETDPMDHSGSRSMSGLG